MATLRKRNGKWQVQVRRKGQSPISKTFHKRADAEAWGRETEAKADRGGRTADLRQLEAITVGDLLTRYRDSVTPYKRGCKDERIVLNALLRCSFASLSVSRASSAVFSTYRDERLKLVKAGTIRREMFLLQHMFTVANREWGLHLERNPLAGVAKPSAANARQRRLSLDEVGSLVAGCSQMRNKLIEPMLRFAIETGMRRSELVRVQWSDLDTDKRTLQITMTKNGHPRTIALSTEALRILTALPKTSDRIFPLTVNSVRLAWQRLTRRAKVSDLHFHDLRHEAVTRLFERGLSVPEVALISGHRDYRMLLRYTHLRPEDVALKLQ